MSDTEILIACPYCFQETAVCLGSPEGIDFMVEDCQVCCNPIEIKISTDSYGEITDLKAEKAY